MEQTMAATAAAEPSSDLGFFARWINIYFSPKKTFEAVRQKSRWVGPFLLMMVLATGFSFLTHQARVNDSVQQFKTSERMANLSAEQQEQAIKQMSNPLWNFFTPIGIAIYYLIGAGILFFLGNILMGGESRFGLVFGLFAYTSLVGVPEMLVKGFLAWAKGTLNTPLSLAALFPADQSETFAYRLINGFDIFSIWFIAVLVIGLATVYNFKTGKVAAWIIPLWILWKVASAALAGLGMMFGG
jgi:hypothetical protein